MEAAGIRLRIDAGVMRPVDFAVDVAAATPFTDFLPYVASG
jgi:hypothetical protein